MNIDTKNMETFIQVAELCSFTKLPKAGLLPSLPCHSDPPAGRNAECAAFGADQSYGRTDRGRPEGAQLCPSSGTADSRHGKRIKAAALCKRPCAHGSGRFLACWILREHYENFRAAYPGITMKMATASTEELFRMLNQNETDLVYTLDHHVYNSDYIIGAEERIQAHFVAAPGFLPFSSLTVPVRELITFPFLLTEKGMSYRRLMDEHLARFSLEVRPVLEFGSADLLCTLVTQGAGVSFLPDYVTEAALKSGRLVRLSMPEFKPELWRQLLYHKDKWVSPAMQTVIEYFSGLSPAHMDASDHMLL